MIEEVARDGFAALGGLSALRFTIKRVWWVRQNLKFALSVKASSRGYNVTPGPRPAARYEASSYTIPETERPHP